MSIDHSLNMDTLPLFPLNGVLFPRFPLRLQVFESRYVSMIEGCIEREEPFGVTLIRAGQEVGGPAIPASVGCTARILSVERKLDGILHIAAVGENRFRLLEYQEAALPYFIGRVEPLEDAPAWGPHILGLKRAADNIIRDYLRALADASGAEWPPLDLPQDITRLGFMMAAIAETDLKHKQRALEMTDSQARLREQIDVLTQTIEALHAAEQNSVLRGQGVYVPLVLRSPHRARYWREQRN